MYRDVDTLNQGQKSQLHQCIEFPPFYVELYEYKFDPTINTYKYYIEMGMKVSETSILVNKFEKRYSEIYNFWQSIMKEREIYEVLKMETFPGKIWFDRNNEMKIKDRFNKMRKCLSCLCRVPGITAMNEFREFLLSECCEET